MIDADIRVERHRARGERERLASDRTAQRMNRVGGKLDGLTGFRLQPSFDVAGGQARRREAIACVGLGVHGTDTSQSAERVKAQPFCAHPAQPGYRMWRSELSATC